MWTWSRMPSRFLPSSTVAPWVKLSKMAWGNTQTQEACITKLWVPMRPATGEGVQRQSTGLLAKPKMLLEHSVVDQSTYRSRMPTEAESEKQKVSSKQNRCIPYLSVGLYLSPCRALPSAFVILAESLKLRSAAAAKPAIATPPLIEGNFNLVAFSSAESKARTSVLSVGSGSFLLFKITIVASFVA